MQIRYVLNVFVLFLNALITGWLNRAKQRTNHFQRVIPPLANLV